MIRGIIFDLDGVLVFTDRFHYLAWKKLADKMEIYFDEKINERLKGVSRRESLDILLEKQEGNAFTELEKEALMEEKNSYYREFLGQMTADSISEETRRTLGELKKRGYLLAIGSSSKNAAFILQKTELEPYFHAVCDGNRITHSKPHPEVFLKAAGYLGLRPEECIVVEDALAGIKAAKAAGMTAVHMGGTKAYCEEDVLHITGIGQLLEKEPKWQVAF